MRTRRLASLPEGAAKERFVDAMFDAVAPRYDLLNRISTFGLDVRWRRRAVGALGLPAPSVVLDVACGTGDLCRELGRAGHVAIGVDRSEGMLGAARATASLLRADALRLPVADGSVDGVVCGFALRNFVAVPPFLRECARVLRPGGRVSLLEVDTPRHPVLRAGHAVYFRRVVPLLGGLLSDPDAYRYLPRSLAYLPDERALLAMVATAGFGDVERRPLTLGVAQLVTATRE